MGGVLDHHKWLKLLPGFPGSSPFVIMAHILVIDDDPDMRDLLAHMLKSAGHQVALASDGKEGMMECRNQPPQLVITDLFMPPPEGFETISQLQKEFPTIPIIATSGKTSATNMLAIARALGAVEVVEKPFYEDQMLAAVKKALSLQSTPVKLRRK
jgi:CheY-like chemotaxis protein